jgi:uncharacterized membrane protein YkoI
MLISFIFGIFIPVILYTNKIFLKLEVVMNTRYVKKVLRLGLAAVLLCSLQTALYAGEEDIDIKDLPQVVLDAFQKAYPNAEIKGASKEDEDGRIAYEIESIDGKQVRDILYSEEGDVLEIEESISFKALPAAVQKTIMDKYADAEVEKAEKITKDGSTSYEVVVETDDATLEIVLDAQGKIVKSESSMEGEEEEAEEESEE